MHGAMDPILRWAVDISSWSPSETEFNFLLNFLPSDQKDAVLHFFKPADQKRAIVSRLLQRLAVNETLGINYDLVNIQRTPEGKPYLVTNDHPIHPAFNFNTSHHGDFVALVAEPYCLMGVDVMAHEISSRTAIEQNPENFFRSFRKCFTSYEWSIIRSAGPDPQNLYDQFYRYWCMKEAYIKAVGIGLNFDLRRAEFHYVNNIWSEEARLYIDGSVKFDWRFFMHKLGSSHWVCVARGPFYEATESFQLHFPELSFDIVAHRTALAAPEKTFTVFSISDLVPKSRLDEYVNIANDIDM